MSNRTTFAMGLLFGLVVALFAVILLHSPEVALASGPAAGGGSLAVTTGLVQANVEYLYVVDGDGKRLLVYGADANNPLSLRYGRNIEYDLKVQDFTNPQRQGPSVVNMKKAVEEAAKNEKPGSGGGTK